MADYEIKDNTGSLFPNDRKKTERHPDHTGKCKIGDVEYYVSAWEKTAKNNKTFLSLAFKAIGESEEF